MSNILGIFTIFLSLVCPIIGITTGLLISLFKRKANLLVVFGVSIAFVGFATHYVYLTTDDMFRYVQYMNAISHIDNIKTFIVQMYSSMPISQYGLNGQHWPLSAVLLFLAENSFKNNNFIAISVLVLVFSIFVRIFTVLKLTADVKADIRVIIFTRFFAIVILLLAMTFKLPVSGFRWYIATDIILLLTIDDIKKGRLLSSVKIFWSVVAALFHPVGWIYFGFRFLGTIFSNKYRVGIRKIYTIPLLFGIFFIMFANVNYIMPMVNQFGAYVDGTGFAGTFEWMRKFFIGWFIVIILMFWRIVDSKIKFPDGNRLILVANMLLASFSLPFFLFQRIYPFTFALFVFYWAFTVVKDQRVKPVDILIVLLTIIVGFSFYLTAPGNYFPPLDTSIENVLVEPIWQ